MKNLIFILICLIINICYAQNPLNIVDSPDKVIQVNGVPIVGLRELSICANNLRPTTLVSSSNFYYNNNDREVRMYISNEGFNNWTEVLFSPRYMSVDPCVLIDSYNNYYSLFLDDIELGINIKTKLKIFKKTPYNHYFYTIDIGDALDKPHGWIDKYDNIYVAYKGSPNLIVKKSTDLGQTWSEPIFTRSLLDEGNENSLVYNPAPNLKTGRNGELYLCWVSNKILFNAFIDGEWYEQDVPINTTYLSSNVFGFPCIEVNSNTSEKDHIYCVYVHDDGSGNKYIYFKKSTDNGVSFGDNEIAITHNYNLNIKPWITYNKEYNIIFCTFYSRSNERPFTYKTFISYSTDEGTTWSEEIQISDSEFPLSTHQGNDYLGITNKGNYIYPMWSDDRDGQFKSYLSPIVIPDLIDLNNNSKNENVLLVYPNPFNPTTEIRYKVIENSDVKIIIYDLMGKEIATLVNEKKSKGEYKIMFDGSKLSSGIYFCKIVMGNKTYTNKLVILK